MDDLASMITQFLGSEDGMDQLRSVASALGLSDAVDAAMGQDSPPAPTPPAAGPDLSAGLGGLSQLLGGPSDSSGGPAIDLNMVMLLQRAMSAFNQTDRNTELLRALKPHFSPERAKKVDDAVRIIQLIKLLPLIKESGLLGLGGGKDS